MKIYAKKLDSIPLEFNVIVDIDSSLIYGFSDANIEGSIDLSDFNLPEGPVISKDRKRITQQMINDFECFVDDVETLCELNYGLEVTYTNISPDHSHYYNFLAKDADGNIIARFRFRLRISNHKAHRTKQQTQNKKSEINSPRLHELLTEEQISKLRVRSEDIVINDDYFDNYTEAFEYVDSVIRRSVEVITR